tara:strand:- start:558 stop:1490 length:933 start_codon:yes stop_codon:yes gene_type:complete
MLEKLKRILLLLLGIVIATELILRLGFGFCDTVLFMSDPDFEYIAQPNQDRHRFGNHIVYNELSMRAEPIDTYALKILALGDSVLNGGVLTDQDSLATSLLSNKLSSQLNRKIQVLNVSAGSWGPDNAYAYLEKFGDFNSRLLVMVFSSHDYNDNITHEEVVGNHPSYPNKQYPLALLEVIDRDIIPRVNRLLPKDINNSRSIDNELMINKNGKNMNTGFEDIVNYANSKNIPLIFFLHPEREELNNGVYSERGKSIIKFYEDQNIPVIKLLERDYKTSYYRDQIHLNESGQRHLAKVMREEILNILENE